MGALLLVSGPLRATRIARRLCDAEGGVLFGARVLTPEALLPGLLAAAGERRGLLSLLAERLLALEAARAAGGPFAGVAPDGGLGRALHRAVAELRRGEVDAAAAREVAAGLEGRAGARLAALAEVLRLYQDRLEELEVLDRPAALRAGAAALRRGARAEETARLDLLVADGFHAPSPGEWDLLSALAERSPRAVFRVPGLAERPDLGAGAEAMVRRVEGLGAAAGRRTVELRLPAADDRAPALARMLRALHGGPGGGPAGEGGRLRVRAGAGAAGEAELAAAEAAALLEDGVDPDDVLLFAPSPDEAAPLLRAAFRARGVPLATGRGGRLADTPPARAVRAALRAAAHPGREELLALAGGGYLAAAPGGAGLVGWLDRAGALEGRGDPIEALRRRAAALGPASREHRGLTAAADELAALRRAVAPLSGAAPAARLAAALSVLLGGARRRAARGGGEEALRDLAALDRVEEAATGLARARQALGRGGEPLAPAEFAALLDGALEGAGAPPPPEPAAGAVELWPLSEAPGLEARAALVLGCARGRFPPAAEVDPLLRDPERAAVNARLRRGALATSGARRADGLLAAVAALAAGRERVTCLVAGPGPEGPGEPVAPLAAEAAALLGTPVEPPPADPDLGAARTEGEALRAAVRALAGGRGDEVLAALGQAGPGLADRAADARARGAMEVERRAAVEARRATPASGLVPALALAPRLPEAWTPTQLEDHARCPFRLLARLGLGLREPGPGGLDIDPRDEGLLVHAALERFHGERIARGLGPVRGDPEERLAMGRAADQVSAEAEARGATGDPAAWAARRGAIRRRLLRVLAAEVAEPTGLTPVLVEYRFGGGAGPPLELGSGDEVVRLQGRIDRVDADGERLLLLDYKNSRDEQGHKDKLDPGELGVTSFQIPTYLLAAARALPGRRRLEASYVLLKSAERLPALALDAADPLLALDEDARARARAEGRTPFADAVLGAVRAIRAGELPVASRGCDHCGFGAVCRFPVLAEEEP